MNEWPKTVQVGGREYEVDPDMSVGEATEVAMAIKNEADKVTELYEALGIEI